LKVSYYRNSCIDFNQILRNDGDYQVVVVGGADKRPTNPRWRTATILKKPLSHQDFDEIYTVTHIGPFSGFTVKISLFCRAMLCIHGTSHEPVSVHVCHKPVFY